MLRKYQLNCKLNFQKYSLQDLPDPFFHEFTPDSERCPSCNAIGQCKPHGYYKRYLTDFDHEVVVERQIRIKRVICSCGHTHGIIPDSIVPYRWYSLPFIIYILSLYFSHTKTTEWLCETYGFSHSTLYRWISVLSDHMLLWLGALLAHQTTALDFLSLLLGYAIFSDFTRTFFHQTLYSFLQCHANPANCDHLPIGWLPVQGAPT